MLKALASTTFLCSVTLTGAEVHDLEVGCWAANIFGDLYQKVEEVWDVLPNNNGCVDVLQ